MKNLFASRKEAIPFGDSLNAANSLFFSQAMQRKADELYNMRTLVCILLMAGKESDPRVAHSSRLLEEIGQCRSCIVSASGGLGSRISGKLSAHLKTQDEFVRLIENSFSDARARHAETSSKILANGRPLADFLKGPGPMPAAKRCASL